MWSKKLLRVVVTFCLGFLLSCIVAFAEDSVTGTFSFSTPTGEKFTLDFPFQSAGSYTEQSSFIGDYDPELIGSLTGVPNKYNALAYCTFSFDAPLTSTVDLYFRTYTDAGLNISASHVSSLTAYSLTSSLSGAVTVSASGNYIIFHCVGSSVNPLTSFSCKINNPYETSHVNLFFGLYAFDLNFTELVIYRTAPSGVSTKYITLPYDIGMAYFDKLKPDFLTQIIVDGVPYYFRQFVLLDADPRPVYAQILSENSTTYTQVPVAFVNPLNPNTYYRISLTDDPGTFDSGVDDASSLIQQQDQYEQSFSNSMSSNFDALGVSTFTMDSDVTSGLQLVGSVFTSTWNSFGKWAIMFSFPLLMGVVLLLIGRVSRYDIHQDRKSKKG